MVDLYELAQLKAEMLCYGVLPDAGTKFSDENPLIDESFIHGAVFDLGEGGIVNTSVWTWNESDDPTPRNSIKLPIIKYKEESLQISNDRYSTNIESLSLGEISDEVVQGVRLGDWFSLHSRNTIFCVPVRQCIFITMGKPCTFCTFESGKISRINLDNFESCLEKIIENYPSVDSIAIGGGTPNTKDMGSKYFSSLVKKAVELGLSTSVEMVPPENLDDLLQLKDAGVSSLIMSLEVWDDKSRQQWCLGKGAISKRQYFRGWEWAQKYIGEDRIASVMLVGSETLESTRAGASSLVSKGVVPTLIPLRWYPDSRFSTWKPVNPQDYIELESELAEGMIRRGIAAHSQPGCTACGGCSLATLLGQMQTLNEGDSPNDLVRS